MSGFVCPGCGAVIDPFSAGGGERMAAELHVPFLGRIPLDPEIGKSGDDGKPYIVRAGETPALTAMKKVFAPILALDRPSGVRTSEEKMPDEMKNMGEGMERVALPLTGGQLASHFGHCEEFLLADLDTASGIVLGTTRLRAPEHEPGLLPRWLKENGAQVVIAGGMGSRAQELFAANGIRVVPGVEPGAPDEIIRMYLAGALAAGANICDH